MNGIEGEDVLIAAGTVVGFVLLLPAGREGTNVVSARLGRIALVTTLVLLWMSVLAAAVHTPVAVALLLAALAAALLLGSRAFAMKQDDRAFVQGFVHRFPGEAPRK